MRRHNQWTAKGIPAQVRGPGSLYLRFGGGGALRRAAARMTADGFVTSRSDGVLTIQAPADLVPLARALSTTLSLTEQCATRAIFEPQGGSLSLRACFDVETLQQFIARAHSGWFIAMMRENRYTTHFQPIVSCRRADQVFGYEGLLRGHDGSQTVAPLEMIDVARCLDLLPALDASARRSAICEAARHRLHAKIFINFNPAAMDDPDNALEQTLDAVKDAGLLREQIVFEVVESECIRDVPALQEACARFRRAGFGLALDDLGSAYSSLKLLGQLRPDYVKLDQELMRGVDADSFKATLAGKLLEAARSLGIATIAEGIETRGEWDWLRKSGADYAQGFYFARAASPPPVMANSGGHFWAAPAYFAA